jgi:hypothetical protein
MTDKTGFLPQLFCKKFVTCDMDFILKTKKFLIVFLNSHCGGTHKTPYQKYQKPKKKEGTYLPHLAATRGVSSGFGVW